MLQLKNEELVKYTDKDGNIIFPKNVTFQGSLYCKGNLNCEGSLNCEGNLNCKGKHFIVMGTFYWSHASMPKIPEKQYINLLMPKPWQREHYADRLGFELHGCYKKICRKVERNIFNLLKDEKWLPVERKMIECIRDHEKPAPEWVDEQLRSGGGPGECVGRVLEGDFSRSD